MIYEPMVFGQSSRPGPFGSQPASSSADPYMRSSQFGGTSTRSSQFGFQPPSRQTDNTNTSSFSQALPFPPFGSTGSSQFGGMLTRNSQFVSQPPSRQTDNTSTNFFPQVSLFEPFGTPYTPAFGWGPAPSQTSPFGSTFQQAHPAFGANTLGLTTPLCSPSLPAFGLQLPLVVVPQAPMVFVSQQPQYMQQQFPQQMVPESAHPLGLQQIRCSVVLDFGYQVPQKLEPQVPPVSSGQNTSPFGTPIASVAQSPFSTQSSVGGRSGFSQQGFLPRQGGTRVETYVSTPSTEVSGSAQNLQSISAMFMYGDKSHEELRWEDYQRGDKGGHKLPASAPVNPFRSASHSFHPENTFFGAPVLDPFSSFSTFPRFQPASGPAFGSSLPFGESLAPAFSFSPSTFGPTVGSSSTSDHAKPSGSFQSFRPSFGCQTVTSTSPFGYSFSSGSSSSLSDGTTTPVFISSPFGSSQASGTSSSSGLSQASTTSIGQAPSLFGPTNAAFGSSQTHVDSESDCFQFTYSPIRQEPSLCGGSTSPTYSSGSSILHSSTVESSSEFGSPLSFGNGNTQSTRISQSSTPSIGQRKSQSGPNSSKFTFPSCISYPFRTPRISVQRLSQSTSQPAASAQTPTAFHSLFGCAPSASLSAPGQTTAAPAFPFSEFGKSAASLSAPGQTTAAPAFPFSEFGKPAASLSAPGQTTAAPAFPFSEFGKSAASLAGPGQSTAAPAFPFSEFGKSAASLSAPGQTTAAPAFPFSEFGKSAASLSAPGQTTAAPAFPFSEFGKSAASLSAPGQTAAAPVFPFSEFGKSAASLSAPGHTTAAPVFPFSEFGKSAASLSAPGQTTAAPAFPFSEFGKSAGSNNSCTLGEKPVDQHATNEETS